MSRYDEFQLKQAHFYPYVILGIGQKLGKIAPQTEQLVQALEGFSGVQFKYKLDLSRPEKLAPKHTLGCIRTYCNGGAATGYQRWSQCSRSIESAQIAL